MNQIKENENAHITGKKRKKLVVYGSKNKRRKIGVFGIILTGRFGFGDVIQNERLKTPGYKPRKRKMKIPRLEDEEPACNEEISEKDLCKICSFRKRNVVILDCGHVHFCVHCIRKVILMDDGTQNCNAHCPICKKHIKKGAQKVFM